MRTRCVGSASTPTRSGRRSAARSAPCAPRCPTDRRPTRPRGDRRVAIGISDDADALREATAAMLARHCPPAVPRALLDAEAEELPSFWGAAAELGWFGLAVPEELGGAGFGLSEAVVVVEQ